MDAEQRGWYIQLLAEAWESEPQATLPNDEPLLKVLAGVNTSSTDVEQRWMLVRNQFKKRGAVVYNERQMEEVVRQEVNKQKKSEAGKASAEARRVEREAIKAQHLRETRRGNRRSTPVGNVLPVCTNTTATESNPSIPSSSSVPVSSSDKKEPSAHAELLKFLELKIGPISNAGKQGKAIKWLLDHSYEVDQCKRCYLDLASETWRTQAVDWATVQSQIGAWLVKHPGPSKPSAPAAITLPRWNCVCGFYVLQNGNGIKECPECRKVLTVETQVA